MVGVEMLSCTRTSFFLINVIHDSWSFALRLTINIWRKIIQAKVHLKNHPKTPPLQFGYCQVWQDKAILFKLLRNGIKRKGKESHIFFCGLMIPIARVRSRAVPWSDPDNFRGVLEISPPPPSPLLLHPLSLVKQKFAILSKTSH